MHVNNSMFRKKYQAYFEYKSYSNYDDPLMVERRW